MAVSREALLNQAFSLPLFWNGSVGDQALCLLLSVLEQTGGHLLSLPDHLLSGRDQLLIERFLLFGKLGLLLFSRLCSSYQPMKLLSHLTVSSQFSGAASP
jgi:hypothetical protein